MAFPALKESVIIESLSWIDFGAFHALLILEASRENKNPAYEGKDQNHDQVHARAAEFYDRGVFTLGQGHLAQDQHRQDHNHHEHGHQPWDIGHVIAPDDTTHQQDEATNNEVKAENNGEQKEVVDKASKIVMAQVEVFDPQGHVMTHVIVGL